MVDNAIPFEHRRIPVFVGTSDIGEKVVLYRRLRGEELFIRVNDGEVWALSPGAKVEEWSTFETRDKRVTIKSPEWTGSANGSWVDTISEHAL